MKVSIYFLTTPYPPTTSLPTSIPPYRLFHTQTKESEKMTSDTSWHSSFSPLWKQPRRAWDCLAFSTKDRMTFYSFFCVKFPLFTFFFLFLSHYKKIPRRNLRIKQKTFPSSRSCPLYPLSCYYFGSSLFFSCYCLLSELYCVAER